MRVHAHRTRLGRRQQSRRRTQAPGRPARPARTLQPLQRQDGGRQDGYKFLRGFSVYDEWQQSGASGDTVAPYYRREKQVTCNSCHMPKQPAANDLAAKHDGVVTSHRWLGANTATPLFFGQTKQVRLTEEFLKAGVLTVDIFALRSEAAGETFAPLSAAATNRVELRPGEEVTADVVVFNRKAAHSFPPELRDMYEPWVEFEALDAAGADSKTPNADGRTAAALAEEIGQLQIAELLKRAGGGL
ncbi:MAG: hypothetical protein M3416_06050 [Acidobacteriota bacterium]|nr:hypothetical protein [Acidobacteriota bacterium]